MPFSKSFPSGSMEGSKRRVTGRNQSVNGKQVPFLLREQWLDGNEFPSGEKTLTTLPFLRNRLTCKNLQGQMEKQYPKRGKSLRTSTGTFVLFGPESKVKLADRQMLLVVQVKVNVCFATTHIFTSQRQFTLGKHCILNTHMRCRSFQDWSSICSPFQWLSPWSKPHVRKIGLT